MNGEFERLERARSYVEVASQGRPRPKVGVILGSGLGAVVQALADPIVLPYSEVPELLASTVEGHAGKLWLGTLDGTPAAILEGRIHLYEGWTPAEVVRPARLLRMLGAESVIVTNAAGGLGPGLRQGDIMRISDQLNLTGQSPIAGPNDPRLGVRFPDMTEAFDRTLAALATRAAEALGFSLPAGVYAGVLGPAYETPAEIRMLQILGADAVGMSTVHEVIALRHAGARVLGLSCISNLAAGLAPGPLSHEDVKASADAMAGRLTALLRAVAAALGE